MAFADKFKQAIEQAAEENDVNEATTAGEFTPLPEGPARLRFVEYIELGQVEKEYKGQKKTVDRCRFGFEVSGPKIDPREDGQPHFIGFEINISQNEKSAYYKLFRKMAEGTQSKIFPELLGNGYKVTLEHNVVGEGNDKKTYVNLTDKDGNYTIAVPFFDNPETGERVGLVVPEAKSQPKCFMWNYADKEQWDSIFIDGEWEAKAAEDGKPAREAKSKNIFQNRIKAALNWIGSPMQERLFGELEVGEAEKPVRTEEAKQAVKEEKAGASADPLNEVA